MGYELDKIEKIEIYDRTTGEKIGEMDPPLKAYTEETVSAEEMNERLAIKGRKIDQFSATGLITPPRPNITMIISPGDHYGNSKTMICFYRPKYYNWFQRLMYKMCFGITIKQGDEVRREFL